MDHPGGATEPSTGWLDIGRRLSRTLELAASTNNSPKANDSIALVGRSKRGAKPNPEYEGGKGYGVDVGTTFELADVFVSATNIHESRRTIERFIDLVFSHPFHPPKMDEMGMYIAYGYSLRSASLSRRVGAAILNADGDVIAVGTNEVPRFKGGLYWAEQLPDYRDFN